MKRTQLYLACFLLSFLSINTSAQILDDFSDGNFDQNPSWTGDAANFQVNSGGQLVLKASVSGQSTLLVEGNIPDSVIWDFEAKLDFAPSNQNLLRIYLQVDQTDLSQANGYYLELGETGSADAIRFFRQDAAIKTLLATGQPGLAANFPNLSFHVERSAAGIWTVEAGIVGAALQPQFTLVDSDWPGGSNRYFGFQCQYTISNIDNFQFDNINIRPDLPDTTPPSLLSAQADQPTQVTLTFDENLDAASAENPVNYSINNGIGQPVSASLALDKKTVVLGLQNALSSDTYILQATGISDLAGNASSVQTAEFEYIKIESAIEFDLIINEIMPDPSPVAGLPDIEWLELFNRSNKIIDLAGLRFSDATSAPVALPSYLIYPGEYIALTSALNAAWLQTATPGKVLGMPFSGSILNNESDVLSLTDASGALIDRVAYNVSWHTVPNKEDGGFSLERINPDLPCLGSENWQSCPATIGGTLCLKNASFNSDPDLIAPRIFKVFPESPNTLILTFTEGMDQDAVEDLSAYQLQPAVQINSAVQMPTDRAVVTLHLATPLQAATVYTLSIENSVQDCSGNAFLFTDTLFIGLSETPEIQDIVINEILPNPAVGGARYIEFYNRSQKIFDWSEFFLASNSDSTTSVVQILQDRLFFPGEYHVFSNDAANVRDHYDNIIKKNVMQNALPSLDDDLDSIKIYWAGAGKSVVVDSFFYYRELHNGLLSTSDQEGVSLERIRIDGPTQAASNWTSASPLKTNSPGTPTLPNSQLLPNVSPGEDLISIPVARLSPDGDAYEDILEIFYTLPKEGYAGSLSIYDSDGNLVKSLARQNLIGTSGVIHWDGDTDAGAGTKARPGIHVLYFEIYSPDGNLKREKKAVVLLGKL